jgi:hypothetical protein
MTSASSDFFADYTEHELQMHAEITAIVEEGLSLKEWRRRFLLDPRWQPTRAGVISRSLQRRLLENWEVFRSLGDGQPPSSAHRNAERELEAYVRGLPGFGVQTVYGHTWCDCSLEQALGVIDLYPVLDPGEVEDTKALLLAHVARRIDASGPQSDVARIYLMNDIDRRHPRHRVADLRGYPVELKALLQGRNRGYPGDRAMTRTLDGEPELTLQLHRVMPTTESRGGTALWPSGVMTLVLAAYLPSGSDPGWVVEDPAPDG